MEVASKVGKFRKEVWARDVGSSHYPHIPWTTQPIMGRACMVLGASPTLEDLDSKVAVTLAWMDHSLLAHTLP